MERSFMQKKGNTGLKQNIRPDGYIYAYKKFHPKAAEYTFFSSAYGTFSGIDHMLGHKTSLNKLKIEIISSIFFNHSGMRPEKTAKRKTNKQRCGS